MFFYYNIILRIKLLLEPWLVWLSGLSAGLQTKGSPVQLPVRAQAWVVDWFPSEGQVGKRQLHIDVSLPLSLPSPLSKNK